MLNPSTLRVVYEPYKIFHRCTLDLEPAHDPDFPCMFEDPLQIPSWPIRPNPLDTYIFPPSPPMETP